MEEALALLKDLKEAYKDVKFQKLLRRAESLHPKRGQRDHEDARNFEHRMQGLLLHVYRTVFPREPWCLEVGWEGYRQMEAAMASVAEDARVIKAKAEINQILNLPRFAQIRPPREVEEPLLAPGTLDGLATSSAAKAAAFSAAPLLTDKDGDLAHEFWEEDAKGELQRMLPRPSAGG